MKSAFPLLRLLFLPVFLICSFISCSSSSGIDDSYTFNVQKSPSFSVSPQVPVKQRVSVPFLITIDSADLVTNPTLSTSLSLIHSVKLTKLSFASDDLAYPITNFDTLRLVVSADSLVDQLLAVYFGSNDSLYLTNADFAHYIKKPSLHYTVTYLANKAPAKTVNFTASTTLVFSAAPLQ